MIRIVLYYLGHKICLLKRKSCSVLIDSEGPHSPFNSTHSSTTPPLTATSVIMCRVCWNALHCTDVLNELVRVWFQSQICIVALLPSSVYLLEIQRKDENHDNGCYSLAPHSFFFYSEKDFSSTQLLMYVCLYLQIVEISITVL